jgi:DNA (cytosine-5)-methyltransferase 1
MALAYYNDNSLYCCQWLRNLIAAGLIPKGDVDERSIQEVQPDDVQYYDQCHFFAGIAGWAYALRLAEWPDDRPIWTGSCPCQPFSNAGKRKGTADARHLWPHFFGLIRACRPQVCMGEQVSGKAGYGWLDGVGSDLEAEGYAWDAVDIPAASINAPHQRNRIYWVAQPGCGGGAVGRIARDLAQAAGGAKGQKDQREWMRDATGNSGATGRLAHRESLAQREPEYQIGSEPWQRARGDNSGSSAGSGEDSRLALSNHPQWWPDSARGDHASGEDAGREQGPGDFAERGQDRRLPHPDPAGLPIRPEPADGRGTVRNQRAASHSGGDGDGRLGNTPSDGRGEGWPQHELRSWRNTAAGAGGADGGVGDPDCDVPSNCKGQGSRHDGAQGTGAHSQSPGSSLHTSGFWDNYTLIGPNPQGRYRRIAPGTPLLAARFPNRVPIISALGNAICPQLAAEVIRAWMGVAP